MQRLVGESRNAPAGHLTVGRASQSGRYRDEEVLEGDERKENYKCKISLDLAIDRPP